jgi:hypothetical protein
MLDFDAIRKRAAVRASVANPATAANLLTAISSVATVATVATIAEPQGRPMSRAEAAKAAGRLVGSIQSNQLATRAVLRELIERCCDVRGDDAANRAALLLDCESLDAAQRADLCRHFSEQAEVWRRAKGLA